MLTRDYAACSRGTRRVGSCGGKGSSMEIASAKPLAAYSLLVPRANDNGEEDDETPMGTN